MDAGLVIKFPIRHALASGCTDVLVLATRPADYANQEPSWITKLMYNIVCAHGNVAINRAFAEHHVRSREAYDLALGRVSTPPNVNIATICSDATENIHRMTIDRAVLHAVAVSYGRKVLRVFGEDPSTWTLPEQFDFAVEDVSPRCGQGA